MHLRLQGCFEYLATLEQVEPEKLPPGLENIASQLLLEPLRKSKYVAVRCLTAQCAVEVLRIYAPTPPYEPEELKVSAVWRRALSLEASTVGEECYSPSPPLSHAWRNVDRL